MRVFAVAGLCAGLLAIALAGCDRAQAPEKTVASAEPSAAYVGIWGVDLAQCKNPQDVMEAPMDISASGFDQHEAHCTFKTITETAPNAWKVSEACTVEGDEQSDEMSFSVSGDKLTLDPGPNERTLMRCP